jgi:hypothetical protein
MARPVALANPATNHRNLAVVDDDRRPLAISHG